MYDTIVIDTVSEAYSDCEKFVCKQEGVQKLGDVAYGAAYKTCEKEFESCLRKITMLGYGLCFICHSKIKQVPGPNDTTIETVSPAMSDRAAEVINKMADITAYIDVYPDENGVMQRRFITRQTPYVKAGSRLPYLPAIIPFSYESLLDAITEAINLQEKNDGAIVVDTKEQETYEIPSFLEIRKEAQELWMSMVGTGEQEEEQLRAKEILKKIEMVFGRTIKLSEITEDQVDLFYLVLLEMRDYKNKMNL